MPTRPDGGAAALREVGGAVAAYLAFAACAGWSARADGPTRWAVLVAGALALALAVALLVAPALRRARRQPDRSGVGSGRVGASVG